MKTYLTCVKRLIKEYKYVVQQCHGDWTESEGNATIWLIEQEIQLEIERRVTLHPALSDPITYLFVKIKRTLLDSSHFDVTIKYYTNWKDEIDYDALVDAIEQTRKMKLINVDKSLRL